MDHITLYPLRSEPGYQYRLWGGRRLANLLTAPLPGDGPIGDALLPDGNDYPAKEAGVCSIRVRDPNESKRVMKAVIACMDRDQPAQPREGKCR